MALATREVYFSIIKSVLDQLYNIRQVDLRQDGNCPFYHRQRMRLQESLLSLPFSSNHQGKVLLVLGERQWVSSRSLENSVIQSHSHAITNLLDSCNIPKTLSRDLGAYCRRLNTRGNCVNIKQAWFSLQLIRSILIPQRRRFHSACKVLLVTYGTFDPLRPHSGGMPCRQPLMARQSLW